MKRRLQGLATRDKLLDSAETLFFERGVVSTTLEDIAHASGMTRGAIYAHFANKWSLLNALFERAAIPLDPFIVSSGRMTASTIGALHDELERRLIEVLQSGAKRRLYSIAFVTAEIEGDRILSRSLVKESVLLAQSSIEAALMLIAKTRGVSVNLDYALEATFIHTCLTGYFRRSLLLPPPSDAEKLLAATIVKKALFSAQCSLIS